MTTPLVTYMVSGLVSYPTVSTTEHGQRPTREQVATLLDQGFSVRQIAGLLGISTQAVYKHLRQLDRAAPSKAAS